MLTTPLKQPVDDGLILNLPLQEGSGRIVKDLSGFDYNGTLVGASWGAVKGGKGFAPTFDGTDDKCTFTKNMIPSSGDYTLMGWVYCEGDQAGTTDEAATAFGAIDIGAAIRGIAARLQGDDLTIIYGDNTGYTILDLMLDVRTTNSKKWYHVTAVYIAATNKMYGYLNAVEKASSTARPYVASPVNFEIGHAGLGSGQSYWYGQLKHIRVYNRAVSVNEIRRIVDKGF